MLGEFIEGCVVSQLGTGTVQRVRPAAGTSLGREAEGAARFGTAELCPVGE